MSRFGRDHIEVGYYTEMVFPMWNIRFIAVNDKEALINSLEADLR